MGSIDDLEVQKFSDLSSEWWDGNGFALLHKVNPLRVQYITSMLKPTEADISRETTLLDIGCGGGILAESMAHLGFRVSAIDPSEECIQAAKNHVKARGLDIEYHCASIDEFTESCDRTYDIITLMEVVEHASDVSSLLASACRLLNKGGLLFVSTLNRSIKSMVLGILVMEYILRWIPAETHKWKKFLKPSEVASILRRHNVSVQDITGIGYKILRNEWCLDKNAIDVNYILAARKIA